MEEDALPEIGERQYDDRLIFPLIEPDEKPALPNEARPADAPPARSPGVLDFLTPPITEETLRRSVEYWALKNALSDPSGELRVAIDAYRFARWKPNGQVPYPLPINHFGAHARLDINPTDPSNSTTNSLPSSRGSGFPGGVWGVMQQWVEEHAGTKRFARHLAGMSAWAEAQTLLRQQVKEFRSHCEYLPEYEFAPEVLLYNPIEPTVETILALHGLPTNPSVLRFAVIEAMKAEGIAVSDAPPELKRGLLVQSVFLAPLYRVTQLWTHQHVDVVTTIVSSSIWGGTQAWRDVERVATHHRSWWEDWTWQQKTGIAASDLGQENGKESLLFHRFEWLQPAIKQAYDLGVLQSPDTRKRFLETVFNRIEAESQRPLETEAKRIIREAVRGQSRTLSGEFARMRGGQYAKRKLRFRASPQ
jgi:hypothetical protein